MFRALWTLKQIWRIPALFVVPFMLLFAKPVSSKYDDPNIPHKKLPKWLSWVETPDQHLPGDMRIDRVRWFYDNLGWYAAAWYWIAWRNVGQGITWGLGKPANKFLVHMSEQEKQELGVHETITDLKLFIIISGWKIVTDKYKVSSETGFWAIPRISIRFKR